MTNSTYSKKLKIASVIITYNRIDEVKAQMDIIRELWQPMFETIDIYHEFNGKKSWYPKKYKEDFLHLHRHMPHFAGANHMFNQGFKHVLESGKKYDYIIASSADTWFFDPKKLKSIILTCSKKRYQLATSLWGVMALGTEFFIITPELAKKVFPLRFTKFINKSLLAASSGVSRTIMMWDKFVSRSARNKYKLLKWTHLKIAIFEMIFTFQVMKVLKNPKKIYLIPGRRAVWPANRFYSPNFYASHHDQIKRKRDILPKIRYSLGDKITNMPGLYKFIS